MTQTTSSIDEAVRTGGQTPAMAIPRVPLGAELPLFCERCGYSLHALPQVRCKHCDVLQFHCPECGHHQPINTLRPAVQQTLGRLRAWAIACSVFFRLNFFGWLLFAWFVMGVEWSYQYSYVVQTAAPGRGGPPASVARFIQRPLDLEAVVSFGLFALGFGMFGRMLLLRWKRGWPVGLVLATLVAAAIGIGWWFRAEVYGRNYALPAAFAPDFTLLLLLTFGFVVLGATIVWPIWTCLVRAFLPPRAAAVLLDWQRSMSDPAPLRRQAVD